MDPLLSSLRVSSSGLEVQSQRLKVVSENIANSNSTASVPDEDPFRRKTVSFESTLDKATGAVSVSVSEIGRDNSKFPLEFDPGNPAADDKGFVRLPNVNVLVEMADMREANQSYEANLQVMRQVRELVSLTIDMMNAR
ncbi:flagellar basal body rod protein FlgC [Notoacmeibacter sp. MSK16QG-6]|uniref:flagellar basal body rod protein FlgC n=1 Tax=Notoacmeibacter sp. MSK16QG-6 TaxID=2957982 RepID=UPI00209F4A9B|nr:flagellar basal body rod protein FlgC [Notoacmeibacter sp. MSK16QG-6]MCP1200914.1 flagellar basal body rod protein FlgC [Notoacmeibacter sp. MSK16QG-6]